MYCNLGQNQFFDDAGAPLSAGRVKIYAKGSDTLLPIYEGNGDGFVPAQNPVITANDGRIPTVFWPAALVDVVVEKNNGDGTYTELDSYVAGLDMASVEAVQGVSSITELRSIMPSENMVVQVNGYYTAGDSPTRKYLWVTGAANIDDGGYVITSYQNYDGGRWVMLWDDPEFLPVSLYGVMCGYSGYAKTSNIPGLEALGHYVLVGSVRVEVPPVILFDWRMAQPTSGQSSPVAYHWKGTFTTTHYVACARGVVFSTGGNPTIHCAGVRGESYATAYWMVDQNYTSHDPAEKISTLMFNGNTQAMHDAFMACAACSKVKVVELYAGVVYGTLGNNDNFGDRIVIDYVLSGNDGPIYTYSGSTLLIPGTGVFYAPIINALKIFMAHFSSDVDHISLGYFGYPGIFINDSKIDVVGPMNVAGISTLESINLGTEADNIGFLTKVSSWAQFQSDIRLQSHVVNLGATLSLTTKGSLYTYSPASGTVTSLNLNSPNGNFPTSDNFNVGDVVTIVNKGEGVVNVTYAGNPGNEAILNQWDACAFIKAETGAWAKMSPA